MEKFMSRAFATVLVASIAQGVRAEAPVIDHHAVGCIVVGRFPRFEARFVPIEMATRGRVRFRPGGGGHWYSVAMTKDGEAFVGVIPKPTKKLKQIDYYVEVTGGDFATGRTQEYSPEVVAGPGACQADKIVAGSLAAASVLLEAPVGAAAIPVGFSASGVTAAAAAATGEAAATGTGTAASAGGGGGLSTGVLVGGAVAAAGVGVAAAAAGGGEDTPPPCQPGPVTAVLVSPSTSLQCGQPFRTGIAVTNQTCATLAVQSIQLSYKSLGPCTPGVTLFSFPTTTTVPRGQTVSIDYVSDRYCCFPGPCLAAFQCAYESTFALQTSAGVVAVGTAPIQVSYDPSCAVCP